ncbi:MAG: tetratricopeptide repeat protein [bacterium]|nr:tetratricopeptide repeat protein [bacterium]
MFSFWPQLLIIVSLTGIIIILIRQVPADKTTRLKLVGMTISAFVKKTARELWHFVLEVKQVSKIKSMPHLPKSFPKIHFPKAKLNFFTSEDSLDFYLQGAEVSLEKENFPEAERQLIKVIEKDPKNETAYAILGKMYLSQKKFEEAVETFKFLLNKYPDSDSYWSNLGQAYHGNKLYDKAVEAYEQAIELDPNSAKRYVNLGLTLEARKHLEEAILNYRKAMDLEKENPHFMLVLAEALVAKGEKEEAEKLLEQILLAEPTNHLARERLMQLKF